jgi:hypothetical protein
MQRCTASLAQAQGHFNRLGSDDQAWCQATLDTLGSLHP